ncbi:porin [Rhodophyticola porphyridii]|uniref:Porin n=1 Tax=Rhodophyticola porphyridii TaxID=1852017 RepID=A0A3L9YIL0_9RHOB|nr:porin [Rhodophyticola porphyridii]RMA42640.1 porin [Rhodophyticola porphyridii]
MKKVLFATTALVATAGVAAADVTLSGTAQMGLQGGDMLSGATGDPVLSNMETQFVQDIDVTFTLSGESDNGLTFGAAVDLDENAANVNTDDAGVAIFVSGNFGTLTMGDTDGALDWAMTEAWVGNAGSINDDETSHVGALGSYLDGAYDGQILRYNYSFDSFGFAVSVEMDDSGVRDEGYAVGFTYGMDFGGGSVDFGLGYQVATPRDLWNVGNVSQIIVAETTTGNAADTTVGFGTYIGEVKALGVSAAVTLDNGLSAALTFTDFDVESTTVGFSDFDTTHVGVGVGYTFDAFTVSANWGQFEIDNYGELTGYGLAAAYDMGGGLSMHLGYGHTDYAVTNAALPSQVDGDWQTWSFGLSMSF